MAKRQTRYRGLTFWLILLTLLLALAFAFREFRAQSLELEVARFDLRVSQLQLAVLARNATLIAGNNEKAALQFEGANVFDWLEVQPDEYIGRASLDNAGIPDKSWVYDAGRKVMAYKPTTEMRRWWRERRPKEQEINGQWLQFRVLRLRSNKSTEEVADYLALDPF